MKRGLTLAVGMLSLLGAASVAQAEGFYLTGKIGYSEPLDFTSAATDVTAVSVNGVKMEFDGDVAYGAALGYEFAQHGSFVHRLEFEINHQENDVESTINGGGTKFMTNLGDFELTSYMINTFVDWDLGNCVKPYFGVGIGVGDVEANARYSTVTYTGSDDVFAFQGFVGLSYDVMRNVNLFVEGRYLVLNDAEFKRNLTTGTVNHEGDFSVASISGGVRYTFS